MLIFLKLLLLPILSKAGYDLVKFNEQDGFLIIRPEQETTEKIYKLQGPPGTHFQLKIRSRHDYH